MPKLIEQRKKLKRSAITVREKHEKFKILLDNFDWYWSQSTNNERREKGFKQQEELKQLYTEDKDFKRFYNKYYRQIFNVNQTRRSHVQL